VRGLKPRESFPTTKTVYTVPQDAKGPLTLTETVTANGDLGICTSAKYRRITGGTFRVEASLTGQCPGPVG
jgi:hypothetical protein